jgi:hypothetical protein
VPSYPISMLFSKFLMGFWWSRSNSNDAGERKEKIFIVLVYGGLDPDACVRARSSS